MLARDEGFAAWCLDTLEAHGALVFHGLHLDHVTGHVQSPARRTGDQGRGEHPEIVIVSLDPAVSKNWRSTYPRRRYWHINGTQDDIPSKATILNAIAVAATGGETEFAEHVRHVRHARPRRAGRRARRPRRAQPRGHPTSHRPDPTPEQVTRWRMVPDKVHPLVWTHHTGRRSLVIGATTSHVEGMDVDEGRAFLASLDARHRPRPRVPPRVAGR